MGVENGDEKTIAQPEGQALMTSGPTAWSSGVPETPVPDNRLDRPFTFDSEAEANAAPTASLAAVGAGPLLPRSLDGEDAVPVPTPGSEDTAPASASHALARMHGILDTGSRFGVYIVGKCIGEGGMARIYQAEHAGLRRHVALKVLINGFSRNPEARARFLRESRIAAAIKHPNVVNIFDVGVEDDIPYLVMELLEGTDLERLLAQTGPLDEGQILDIMVPVAAGLSAVHDAGIVHRDLKPGNIFLSQGRYDEIEPKLLDFGISKAPQPADQLRITNRGLLMGTPYYMSPEAVRGGELTPLSDQYSLAVVMYECATGHPPFNAANLNDLAHTILTGNFKPLTESNLPISTRLAAIIDRAMSLAPERRFPDLRAMGRELLTLAGQRTQITWSLSFGTVTPVPRAPLPPTAITPLGSVAAQPSSSLAFSRRAKNVTVALAAIGVGLAILLTLRLTSTTTPRPPTTGPVAGLAEPRGFARSRPTSPVASDPAAAVRPPPRTPARSFGGARRPARVWLAQAAPAGRGGSTDAGLAPHEGAFVQSHAALAGAPATDILLGSGARLGAPGPGRWGGNVGARAHHLERGAHLRLSGRSRCSPGRQPCADSSRSRLWRRGRCSCWR